MSLNWQTKMCPACGKQFTRPEEFDPTDLEDLCDPCATPYFPLVDKEW